MWNRSQRGIVLAIVVGILVYLCIQRWRHPTYLSDPQPAAGRRAAELADRVDPNLATMPELAAIPNVGEKLAAAIVEFREEFVREHPGQIAYWEPQRLLAVKGLGVGKMEAMMPYLSFPKMPTTRP